MDYTAKDGTNSLILSELLAPYMARVDLNKVLEEKDIEFKNKIELQDKISFVGVLFTEKDYESFLSVVDMLDNNVKAIKNHKVKSEGFFLLLNGLEEVIPLYRSTISDADTHILYSPMLCLFITTIALLEALEDEEFVETLKTAFI